jgi:hypothetical protein
VKCSEIANCGNTPTVVRKPSGQIDNRLMRIFIIITLLTICLTAIGQTSIDTESKYTRSDVKGVTIQNSFPKGGLKYTDHNGKVYVYAVFWTRIINETHNPFKLAIDFPADSLELASSAGRYFKLLIPSDTMTFEKEKLFNYGLSDLESFLIKI